MEKQYKNVSLILILESMKMCIKCINYNSVMRKNSVKLIPR